MASLIKKPVYDVGTSERNTSPRINKFKIGLHRKISIKKPRTKLPSGGSAMEANVLVDGFDFTAFVHGQQG